MRLLAGNSPVGEDRRISPDAGVWALHPDGAELLDACGSVSWLSQHPAGEVVYAIGRRSGGRDGDAATGVSAIGPSLLRAWRLIGTPDRPQIERIGEVELAGDGPCHLSVDAEAAYVAYYTSGQVGRIGLDAAGAPVVASEQLVDLLGSGPHHERQESSHPHQVLTRGDGRLVVTDLGADAVVILDASTLVEESRVAMLPGTGPRHTVLLGDSRMAVAGELASSVAMIDGGRETGAAAASAFEVEARNYPSDIRALPRDRIVVANRGAHTLAVFDVTGDVPSIVSEWPAGGAWPHTMAVSSDAQGATVVVADRDGDAIVAHRLDDDTAETEWSISIARPTALLDLTPTTESEDHS